MPTYKFIITIIGGSWWSYIHVTIDFRTLIYRNKLKTISMKRRIATFEAFSYNESAEPGKEVLIFDHDQFEDFTQALNESIKIKDPNSLIVGKKYKITWPNYDDYDEGLEPEVDVMQVVSKNKKDGYVLKNLEHGWTISRHPNMLIDCDVELLEEGKKV